MAPTDSADSTGSVSIVSIDSYNNCDTKPNVNIVKVITPVTSPIPTIDTKIAANSVFGIVRIIFITKRIHPVKTVFFVINVVARKENGMAKSTPSKVLKIDI